MVDSRSRLQLSPHANYARLRHISIDSHARGRAASGIHSEEVALARLYSYAFRLHVIGAFHATRLALEPLKIKSASAGLQIQRAIESLVDLANRGMDSIAEDERALISAFHFYSTLVQRTLNALEGALESEESSELSLIADCFQRHMQDIVASNGIYLTRDTHAPEQASFVVPNLGITIVPLVYGDHHSWNLAWLDGQRSDVPFHRHHEGVEIHLGYSPMHGYTILGDAKAEVTEGYAMPIPPETRHGYTNIGDCAHHVPFVFGSQTCSGWGVFLDVEPSPSSLSDLETKPVQSAYFNGTVMLEREIEFAASKHHPVRYPVIPARLTDRGRAGGLELSIARVTQRGSSLCLPRFCAVSVVRGHGKVRIAGQERTIQAHDHFGIPANLRADFFADDGEPLVLLDAVLAPSQL